LVYGYRRQGNKYFRLTIFNNSAAPTIITVKENSMTALSARQKEIYGFIRKYISNHQYPPTRLDIASAIGICRSAAVAHLNAMKRKGCITWEPNIPRSIQLVRGEQ
jgi:SOS-response transcriptional repressor LexA